MFAFSIVAFLSHRQNQLEATRKKTAESADTQALPKAIASPVARNVQDNAATNKSRRTREAYLKAESVPNWPKRRKRIEQTHIGAATCMDSRLEVYGKSIRDRNPYQKSGGRPSLVSRSDVSVLTSSTTLIDVEGSYRSSAMRPLLRPSSAPATMRARDSYADEAWELQSVGSGLNSSSLGSFPYA